MPLQLVPEEEVVTKGRVPKGLKGLEVKKGPAELLLGIVRARKPELIGGKPIIPTDDPCCANVCGILNNTIERKEKALNRIVKMGGYVEYQRYREFVYETEALKEHRALLKMGGSCNCVEEATVPIGETPIILDKPVGKERKKTPKEQLIEMALRRAPAPKKVRARHETEVSAPATHDGCCTMACDIINKDIDRTDSILNNMELRGAFQKDLYKTPRYEALVYKANALKDYRRELRSACECVEYKIRPFIKRE